jgi:hypothetical protein
VARPNDLRWAHKQALDSRTENKVCQHFQGQRRILRRQEKYCCFFLTEIMFIYPYPASSKRDVRVVTIRGVRGAVAAGRVLDERS